MVQELTIDFDADFNARRRNAQTRARLIRFPSWSSASALSTELAVGKTLCLTLLSQHPDASNHGARSNAQRCDVFFLDARP
jgi:hypothetical protein